MAFSPCRRCVGARHSTAASQGRACILRKREHSSREETMDFHHVIEAAGIVALGLVFYSYLRRWLESTARIDRRLRALLNGVFFGLLSIALMISRIEFAPGAYVDARAVPIALVTLVEGSWAGLVAAIVAASYRLLWMGGSGAV